MMARDLASKLRGAPVPAESPTVFPRRSLPMAVPPTLGVDAFMADAMARGIPSEQAAAILMLCLVKTVHGILEERASRGIADIALAHSLTDARRLLDVA